MGVRFSQGSCFLLFLDILFLYLDIVCFHFKDNWFTCIEFEVGPEMFGRFLFGLQLIYNLTAELVLRGCRLLVS